MDQFDFFLWVVVAAASVPLVIVAFAAAFAAASRVMDIIERL